MWRKIRRWLFWLVVSLLVIILTTLLAFSLSPRPSAYLIKRMFDGPVTITDKSAFQSASKNVTVTSNVVYPSHYQKNTLDIYRPKNVTKSKATLVWVHGGGYVGGDKSGMKEFATKIAADAKLTVVAINYQLAPTATYPSQLYQLNDAISYLKSQSNLNTSKIIVGGDSAGAQIALQYAALATNKSYAKSMKFQTAIPKDAVKGAISYCGPVNLKQVLDQKSDSLLLKWFVHSVAWSELGTRQWQKSVELKQASLVDHVTTEFPPAYIADGNAYSFQDQGFAFVKKLQQLGVPVTSQFFNHTSKSITHEYQFNYQKKEAKKCYQQTLAYITSVE